MSKRIKEQIADNLISLLPFYHKKIFRPRRGVSGMQAAQYRTLGVLLREGTPLPMSELGKRMYISKPYMTLLVDQLIREGHARRIPDPDDRRVINITITPAGTRYLKQGASIYKETIMETLTGLDRKDLEELCRSLEKIRTIIARIE